MKLQRANKRRAPGYVNVNELIMHDYEMKIIFERLFGNRLVLRNSANIYTNLRREGDGVISLKL